MRRRDWRERWAEKVSPEPNTGCWLWTGAVVSGGYGSFTRTPKVYLAAHRASWELHYGRVPDGLCVLHRCDNRACVNPSHLFLGDYAANARDRMLKGRNGDTGAEPGEANHQAKLTLDQVAVIRMAREVYGGTALLARVFGVSSATISGIRRNQKWKG